MKRDGRECARGLAWLAWGLVLAESVGVVGCSEPGQGTTTVAPEARQRLLPHAGPKAIEGKEAAVGKTLSIKDRRRAAAAPAEAPEK